MVSGDLPGDKRMRLASAGDEMFQDSIRVTSIAVLVWANSLRRALGLPLIDDFELARWSFHLQIAPTGSHKVRVSGKSRIDHHHGAASSSTYDDTLDLYSLFADVLWTKLATAGLMAAASMISHVTGLRVRKDAVFTGAVDVGYVDCSFA